jgi:hypothetical protein
VALYNESPIGTGGGIGATDAMAAAVAVAFPPPPDPNRTIAGPWLFADGLGRGGAPLVRGTRDFDVLRDIKERLQATAVFMVVGISDQPVAEGDTAVVAPYRWDEVDQYDDASGDSSVLRHVRWQLTLTVREVDPELRDRRIDQLYAIAANVLDGQPLGGICLPGLSKLRSGEWQKPAPPERQQVIYGEFSYFIDGNTAHGTGD